MDTERNCPSCRKPLPPNAPKGLCPECLMKAGFGSGVAPEPGQPSRTPAFVPPPVAEVARLFPQFEILQLLGQGGMGAVYKARQPALDRMVALKILPPQTGADSGFADRFTREARALARLSHPNIVAVHEFGQVSGGGVPLQASGPQPSALSPQPPLALHYFVMEYVEGLNLRQLEQAGRLSPREALKIIPQICDALQFAHDEGIVHRDIKPENVMLDKKGRVKITDFGLAKILGREPEGMRLTGAKDVMGTPHYMAPEQIEHPQEVDHRADIYSLGVVFYEMLTGELPLGKFQAPSRKVQVDVRFDEVVLHALEKEPERRYQQASQVKTDVETIAATPPGSSRREEAQTGKPQVGPQKPEDNQSLLTSAATEQGARFSRAAIWGAMCVPVFIIAALWVLLGRPAVLHITGLPPVEPAWWRVALSLIPLPFALLAPFGTTILGGIAISQIKHSQGRLYGLGLAVFDVLLFPLLAVNGLLIGGLSWFADQVDSTWILHLGLAGQVILMGGLMVTSCAIVSWLIVRTVWRAANRPPHQPTAETSQLSPGAPPAQPPAASNWKAMLAISVAVVLVIVAIPAGVTFLSLTALNLTRERTKSPARVVAVEEKLRQEIKRRLSEGGWKLDGLSVSVSPDLKRVECRFETARKDGSAPIAIDGGIRVTPQGGSLWLVEGDQEFQFMRFSVDTSAQMTAPPAVFQYAEPEAPGDAESFAVLAPRFGPVREATLNDIDDLRGGEALDLDSGQLLDLPKDIEKRPKPERLQWLVDRSADLLLDRVDGKWGLLTTTSNELKLAPLGNESWDAIAEQSLSKALAAEQTSLEIKQRGPWQVYVLATNMLPPLTFAFVTASGTTGLLQITRFTEAPNSERLRYKLVMPGTADGGVGLAQQAFMRRYGLEAPVPGGVPGPANGMAGPTSGVTSAEQGFKRRYGLETAVPGGVPGPASSVPAVKERPTLLAQAAPGEYRVKLTNGVEFEVVAIASSPRSGMVWWQPDGTLLADPPGNRLEFPSQGPGGKARAEFAILTRRAESAALDPELPLTFEPRPQVLHNATLYKSNVLLTSSVKVVGFDKAPGKLSCRIGLPDGEWQRVATWDHAGALLDTGNPNLRSLIQKAAGEDIVLTLQHEIDLDHFHLRLIARLRNGEHRPAQIFRIDRGPASAAQMSALIHNLRPSDVVAYELYRAAVRWVEIPNIATKPNMPPVETPQPGVTFGPVIERQLRLAPDAAADRGLDLDNGRLLSAPAEVLAANVKNRQPLQNWMAQRDGPDLAVTDVPASTNLYLHLRGVGLLRLDAYHKFDSITAGEARARIRWPSGLPRDFVVMVNVGSRPVFLFKTRDGGMGVLQIHESTDNPRGVKIRYKLLQTSGKTARLEDLSEADRARAVALFNDIEDFGHEFEAAFASKSLPAAETGTRRLLNLLSNFNAVVRGTGYEFSPGIFEDLGKVQQALKEGDWDKVQEAARGNDAYRQEFKRIAGRMVELARQQQQASIPDAPAPTASVRLMQPDPIRRYWRWQVQRPTPARLIYGVLDVTDPQHPQNVLMGMERTPAQGAQDYVLRLNPERDQWRIEIEDQWAGENDGRGATWERLRCSSDASLSATTQGSPRELTCTNYTVLWKGELATSGRKLKSLWFVARLAQAGDPVTDILDASDAVRTFDGSLLPMIPKSRL